MRHFIGLNSFLLNQRSVREAVFYDPSELINGHALICGMTGTGKSEQSRRLLGSAGAAGLRVDVIDVHNEFANLPGSVSCIYSQATGYGYNPLVLDTDPHTGGVNTQVNAFVRLIRSVTPQFGPKQEAALRYLLVDTYAAKGIFADNRQTWMRASITEEHRRALIDRGEWNELKQFYPTLSDLHSYARKKIRALTVGGDNKSISALERLLYVKKQLDRAQTRLRNTNATGEEVLKLEDKVEKLKKDALETYTRYLDEMETGRELDDILKYDSVDVLKSIVQRLDLLNSTGLFQANEPPFGDALVRVHQIKALSTDQQIMFVKLRLQALFDYWKRQGPQNGVQHVIFLDEAHIFFSSEKDDIINILAKEARKFGIALWCSSQSPTEFPEAFATNVGATFLLGIHPKYWNSLASQMRIEKDQLKWIKAKEVLSVRLDKGQADPRFTNVVVPNPSTPAGRIAADEAA